MKEQAIVTMDDAEVLQVIWTPPQIPLAQVSVCVHLLPSSQALPSCLATGAEHIPVDGSHVLTSWQVSGIVHTTGLAPAQLPA